MASISTTAAVLSCGLLLCASYAASGTDEMKAGQSVSRDAGATVHRMKSEEGIRKGVQTIRGEVVRIEHDNFFVKQYDGKEVAFHIDEMTQMTGNIGQGEQIEAKVNAQNHALSIRAAHASRDRRNYEQ